LSEYYQTVCPKDACPVYYVDGVMQTTLPSNTLKTWHSTGVNHQSAYVYGAGKSLDDSCPSHLKDEWGPLSEKIKAYMVSYVKAKIDTVEYCVRDLVPRSDLDRYLEMKTEITKHVFQNFPPAKNFSFLTGLDRLLAQIKKQKLNVNPERLRSDIHDYKARQFWKRASSTKPYVVFDMFRTRTGRLATCRGSFPILTMAKEYRKIIEPVNDYFVELDYNAAELRVLLALGGLVQPAGDIHEWNRRNIYGATTSREVAKKRIFAWLYNPESKDAASSKVYKKNDILKKYYVDGCVSNPFGRQIECDDYHALNYLIQSTTSDMFLRQVLGVAEIVDNRMKKSFISFLMHDSVLLDIAKEDIPLIKEIAEVFMKTPLGDFKVNMRVGTNYGNLKERKNEN
jgi:hypothetical protein